MAMAGNASAIAMTVLFKTCMKRLPVKLMKTAKPCLPIAKCCLHGASAYCFLMCYVIYYLKCIGAARCSALACPTQFCTTDSSRLARILKSRRNLLLPQPFGPGQIITNANHPKRHHQHGQRSNRIDPWIEPKPCSGKNYQRHGGRTGAIQKGRQHHIIK